MAKPTPYSLKVEDCRDLSPNMRRITLSGSSLATFPKGQDGAYVKLIFPNPEQEKPLLRTYTVKECDPEQQRMEIDFVIHADGGPASTWAINATVGDRLNIVGPGPKKVVDPTADWFLIAGDMAALPAIRTNLRHLPNDAKGHLVLEVMTEADKEALDMPLNQIPPQLQLHWLINSHLGNNKMFSQYMAGLEWFEGSPSIWIAGELKEVLTTRTYLKQRATKKARSRYISSYWQFGMSEERHKKEKSRLLNEPSPPT